ncbi:hypothetical protein P7C70_g4204, partial [Phenoliferia sp. Uapishka_3]
MAGESFVLPLLKSVASRRCRSSDPILISPNFRPDRWTVERNSHQRWLPQVSPYRRPVLHSRPSRSRYVDVPRAFLSRGNPTVASAYWAAHHLLGQLQKKQLTSSYQNEYDITNPLAEDPDDGSTVFSQVEEEFESDEEGDENNDGEDFDEEFFDHEIEPDSEEGALVKRDSARQRIELFSRVLFRVFAVTLRADWVILCALSWPKARSGQTWLYRWNYSLAPVSTSSRFFHIAQLIRRNPSTPIITLNAVNGRIVFAAPGLKSSKKNSDSVPIRRFVGITTQHIVRVKYGVKGNIRWIVKDVKSRKTIMSYHAKGEFFWYQRVPQNSADFTSLTREGNMGNNGSIKYVFSFFLPRLSSFADGDATN